MVFESVDHRTFYREKLARARYRDSYHKSLIYILGISEDTRRHCDEIYVKKVLNLWYVRLSFNFLLWLIRKQRAIPSTAKRLI